MKKDLKGLLNFVDFTHKFQQVKRTILATGEDRDEDDADHSFQLAMVGWYLLKSEKLSLDEMKVIRYALVHDLVEVYAGDTYFHTKDQALKDSKAQREHEALEKIKATFTEFGELAQMIEEYESQLDPESRFVYALDKILPVLNIYLDEGKSWHRDKVSYDMVRTKDEKVAVSKDAENIWRALLKLLDGKDHLFPTHI